MLTVPAPHVSEMRLLHALTSDRFVIALKETTQ